MALRASISLTKLQASVSAERLTASINYSKSEATEIWTDPDSKNRMVRDEVPLSEVLAIAYNKILDDGYSVTELASLYIIKRPEDSVSTSDAFSRVVEYNRSFTDAFTLDDAYLINKDFYGNKGNIFGVSDIVGLQYEKLQTDSVSTSDQFDRVVEYNRTFTDQILLHDTMDGIVLNSMGLNESLLNEPSHPNTSIEIDAPKADTMGISDITGIQYDKSESDSYSLSDVQVLYNTLSKTDSVSTSDTSVMSLSKIISDALILDDSALINKDFYGYKGNIFSMGDVLTRTIDYYRTFNDSYSVNDQAITNFNKIIQDSIQVYDTTDGVVFNSMGLNTSLLNELPRPNTSIEVDSSKADALGVVDVTGIQYNKPQTDSVSTSDSQVLYPNLSKEDSVTFSDQAAWNVTLSFSDAFALDDAAQINKDYVGTKGNVFSMGDTYSHVVEYNRSFSDSYSFYDQASKQITKSIQDSIQVHDESAGFLFNNDLLNTEPLNAVADQAFRITGISDKTDSVGIGDLASLDNSLFYSDSFGATDTIGSTITKSISDSFALDDSALINKDFIGTKGNIVSMGDQMDMQFYSGALLNGAPINSLPLNNRSG